MPLYRIAPTRTVTPVLQRRCRQARLITVSEAMYLRYLRGTRHCPAVNPRPACAVSSRGAGRRVSPLSVQTLRPHVVGRLRHPGSTRGIRQVPLHVPSHHICLESGLDLIAIDRHSPRMLHTIERARSKQHRARRRPSPSGDPPPLFQAHPQSLKYALLDASCLSTDVILRKSPYRDGRAPDDAAKTDLVDIQGVALLLKKAKEGPNKHARKLSASISSSGWTKNLFVLVDSGYLLQYAGHGRMDRLPEKMMQLGKHTVAFASDAIPGRHWVLQVSQTAGEDAIVIPEPSRGILSRIGLQSAASRRMTQNFLMVFNSAEDLDSWLTTIRKEVEALGGRQYPLERPTDTETQYLPAHTFSHRVSVRKDNYQFPGSKFAPSHQVLSPVESEFPENDGGPVNEQMLEFRFWDTETTSQHISEDSSTITSTDLDRLRDSKDSKGSTGTDTSISFHGHSPSSPPGQDTFAVKPSLSLRSVNTSVVLDAHIGAARIRDPILFEPHSPTFLCHALDAIDADGDTQKETHACVSSARKLPGITPNFSVPISSNRFSFFGSSEALNLSTSRGTTATSVLTPEDDSIDEDSAEDDSFSRRPVSTIAPLPTPDALMNPTGMRNRTSRRPSVEKPLPSQPVPALQHSSSSFVIHDYTSSSGHGPMTVPQRFSSLEPTMPTRSAPLPSPKKELPALPRSKSYQGLSTFYNAGEGSTRTTFRVQTPRGQNQQRPLSLSGFPEPPSCVYDTASSNDTEFLHSSLLPTTLVRSSVTSLPTVTITEAHAEVNSRISRIRVSRGLPKLGVIPPAGPPPSCPLPDTPSPRKRNFRSLSKRNSCSDQT